MGQSQCHSFNLDYELCFQGITKWGCLLTSAYQVWKDLQERYDKPHGTQIFHLQKQIHSFTHGSLSISAYYTKLYGMNYLLMWQEKSRKYIEYMQNQHLCQFLMGPNGSYTQVRSQILLMSPLP